MPLEIVTGKYLYIILLLEFMQLCKYCVKNQWQC